jgi:hypothetical protein
VPTIRARYKARRDAMQAALEGASCLPGAAGSHAVGGMFFWVELPAQLDATALLPQAVAAGMAFVPGAPFFPQGGHANTMRLSFVTATPAADRNRGGSTRLRAQSRGGARMKPRRFDQLDVFSAVPLKGNPLAVVHAAADLSATTMAAFARWTNLSETTFLLPPTDPQADYRVRIFTPVASCPLPATRRWAAATHGLPRAVNRAKRVWWCRSAV